jgi:hypothetical protein
VVGGRRRRARRGRSGGVAADRLGERRLDGLEHGVDLMGQRGTVPPPSPSPAWSAYPWAVTSPLPPVAPRSPPSCRRVPQARPAGPAAARACRRRAPARPARIRVAVCGLARGLSSAAPPYRRSCPLREPQAPNGSPAGRPSQRGRQGGGGSYARTIEVYSARTCSDRPLNEIKAPPFFS